MIDLDIDIERIKSLRHTLHQYPEVSGKEHETAKRICHFLKENAPPDELITEVGGTGILAIYKGEQEGETVLFRAELDALPIQEENEMPYRSVYDGVSHKCGHDGHASTLVGLACFLAQNPPEKGRAILLFQPSEENGRGAQAVCKDDRFKDFCPDWVFAYHNLPQLPLNEVIVRDGSFTAAVQSLILRFEGKTAHAAEPENGVNPAMAIAEIIMACQQMQEPNANCDDFKLITPVYACLGEKAYGVSAGYGELHLTIRAWKNAVMRKFSEQIIDTVEQITKKHHLEFESAWTEMFLANRNHQEANQIIRKVAQKANYKVTDKDFAFKWGEDFGFFTEKFKGAMFGIGAGEQTPALHNPDYDFPDEILDTGVHLFIGIAKTLLFDKALIQKSK